MVERVERHPDHAHRIVQSLVQQFDVLGPGQPVVRRIDQRDGRRDVLERVLGRIGLAVAHLVLVAPVVELLELARGRDLLRVMHQRFGRGARRSVGKDHGRQFGVVLRLIEAAQHEDAVLANEAFRVRQFAPILGEILDDFILRQEFLVPDEAQNPLKDDPKALNI